MFCKIGFQVPDWLVPPQFSRWGPVVRRSDDRQRTQARLHNLTSWCSSSIGPIAPRTRQQADTPGWLLACRLRQIIGQGAERSRT
jgi:hypothetical protein